MLNILLIIASLAAPTVSQASGYLVFQPKRSLQSSKDSYGFELQAQEKLVGPVYYEAALSGGVKDTVSAGTFGFGSVKNEVGFDFTKVKFGVSYGVDLNKDESVMSGFDHYLSGKIAYKLW